MNKEGIKKYLLEVPVVNRLLEYSKKLVLPGFEGIPIFNVVVFFIRGLMVGHLQTRAKSLAFSFFLAVFPFVIFVFTLIAYIPVPGFQEQLISTILQLFPAETAQSIETTIEDIVTRQRGGLMSFGFLFALYFSTNAVYALISGFSNTYHQVDSRSGFKRRLVSLILTIVLAILMFLAVALIIASEVGINFIANNQDLLVPGYLLVAFQILKWLILIFISFLSISILYYFGPANRKQWKFISAGGTLATLLIIITSLGFIFFIENFGSYNKIYGSISTLIILLLYIYINSTQLIVGFELNAAIETAKSEAKEFETVTREMQEKDMEKQI